MTALGSQTSTASSGGVRPQPRRGRRLVAALASITRIVVVVTLLVLIYGTAPWDRRLDVGVAAWIVLWLVVLIVVVAWEVRTVMRSPHPAWRAAESAAFSVALLLLPFASVYAATSATDPGSFSQSLTRTDALYFAVTVFSTVGFGDITATSQAMRIVVTVQMLADLILLGVIVRVLVTAAQQRRQVLRASPVDVAAPPDSHPVPGSKRPGNGADGA